MVTKTKIDIDLHGVVMVAVLVDEDNVEVRVLKSMAGVVSVISVVSSVTSVESIVDVEEALLL